MRNHLSHYVYGGVVRMGSTSALHFISCGEAASFFLNSFDVPFNMTC